MSMSMSIVDLYNAESRSP